MEMAGGLLIVNADDLGYDPHHTDAARECLGAGRITSATAMVYMQDSDRASAVFRNSELGIGLHLNFSEAFTDPNTPADVRARQARLLPRFREYRRRRLRRWLYDPFIRSDVEGCIADQLQRFEQLYGRPPTHVDGHQHVHLSPNVVLSRAIPRGTLLRNSVDHYPLGRSAGTAARALRQRAILSRFRSTDRLFDITEVDPRKLGSDRANGWLPVAGGAVEVMCHPGFAHEFDTLMSDEWEEVLGRCRLGSFADLRALAG
jgi:chitin disaccharide deacetylase